MARPVKTGLTYFPKDVDFWDDFKVMELLNEYGPTGTAVYDIVISMVYRNGYYLEAPIEMIAAMVVRIVGNRWIENKNKVVEIINFCGEIGLFDKELLAKSVITSVGIQKRYREITSRSKADKSKYWLLEEEKLEKCDKDTTTPCENPPVETHTEINASETPVFSEEIPQKKSKVNKSKLNKSKVCAAQIPCRNGTFDIDQKMYDELTHTYPNIDICKSLDKLKNYLSANPDKQRFSANTEGYIRMWLANDNDTAPKKDRYAPIYDLSEYENYNVIDELMSSG